MGLFSTKIEEEIVAVLEISSGGVSGALFLKDQKKLPFVLATASTKIRIRESVDASMLQKEILAAVDHICSELQTRAIVKPSKIYCIMSTPWAHGELRSIHVKKEKEFHFTEVYAQKLIASEIAKLQEEIKKDLQIIDKKITKVSLNGYNVKSPHGQKTTAVVLEMFLSFAYKSFVQDLEDKIHKTFKSKIFFTSQMLADFVFARDFMSVSKDALILNIGAEITEVVLVKGEYMTSTAFFPYGANNLIRNMAIKLGKTIAETESLFRLYNDNSLDVQSEELVERGIKFTTDMWQSGLKQVLLEMLPNRHLPETVFLFARDEVATCLYSKISNQSFPEFTTGHTEFDVIIPSTKTLHDFYDKAEIAKPDSNILIKTIYINQL